MNEMLDAVRNLKDRSVLGARVGCPAPPQEPFKDGERSARQVRNALTVHLFHTDKVIVAATSPRVAKLKAGHQQLGRVPSEGEIELVDVLVGAEEAQAKTSEVDKRARRFTVNIAPFRVTGLISGTLTLKARSTGRTQRSHHRHKKKCCCSTTRSSRQASAAAARASPDVLVAGGRSLVFASKQLQSACVWLSRMVCSRT